MPVVPVLVVALVFGAGVFASYALQWAAIQQEWAVWRSELPTVGLYLWACNALLCIPAYFTVVQYAYTRDHWRLAAVLAAFSASACTWAPALRCGKYAVASVRSTGVLSIGFLLIYMDVPHHPAYWAAPAVLVLQHVGFDLGWWASDYCGRQTAKPRALLLIG